MDKNNRMLIDATHPEETRVVVLRNGRVEEFDYESAARKLLRGNIYLAKVTRVEPSLQAAFVDYGGNRHGFLAFSEIHPDYYQIPIADRQALLRQERDEARHGDEEFEPFDLNGGDRESGTSETPEESGAAAEPQQMEQDRSRASSAEGAEAEPGRETADEAPAAATSSVETVEEDAESGT